MCHLSIFGWEHSGKGLVAFSSHTLSLSLSAVCFTHARLCLHAMASNEVVGAFLSVSPLDLPAPHPDAAGG